MNTCPEVSDNSLLSALEKADGRLNREGFPMLAYTLDKKYAVPGAYVVRWLPGAPTVELSDGTQVEKKSGAH